MDENTKKMLEELRALGVKAFTWDSHGADRTVTRHVEFFEPAAPASQFGAIDIDTIVPPADRDTEPPPAP
jgi:hypothetical protein